MTKNDDQLESLCARFIGVLHVRLEPPSLFKQAQENI
jgi:hypothetical protein